MKMRGEGKAATGSTRGGPARGGDQEVQERRRAGRSYLAGIPEPRFLGNRHVRQPLDLEWLKAADHARRRSVPAGGGCPWTMRAVDYLRALAEGVDDPGAIDPVVHSARMLQEGDRMERAFLQGRLLARQPFDGIDAACGLLPGTAEAFHALFFPVQDLAGADLFVLFEAVGAPAVTTMGPGDFDCLTRWLGMRQGVVPVGWAEELHRRGLDVPADLGGASREELEGLAGRLFVHRLLIARTTPFSKAGRTIRLEKLARDLERLIDAREPVSGSCPDVQDLLALWDADRIAANAGGTIPSVLGHPSLPVQAA